MSARAPYPSIRCSEKKNTSPGAASAKRTKECGRPRIRMTRLNINTTETMSANSRSREILRFGWMPHLVPFPHYGNLFRDEALVASEEHTVAQALRPVQKSEP